MLENMDMQEWDMLLPLEVFEVLSFFLLLLFSITCPLNIILRSNHSLRKTNAIILRYVWKSNLKEKRVQIYIFYKKGNNNNNLSFFGK